MDDDEAFRLAFQETLKSMGHEVVVASSGKQALNILKQDRVELVISDILMPEMSGIELTRLINESYRLPVILITGFAEILETQEAFQLGANEFLPKPIERKDLAAAIDRCLSSSKPSDGELTYCKIGIEDFSWGRKILFGIFVRLSDDKFVKIAHRGEDLTRDRIITYKQKGMHFLYLRKEDFRTYVGFNLGFVPVPGKSSSIFQEKKLKLIRKTGEILNEQVAHAGVDEGLFNGSVTFVETAVEVLSDDPEVFTLLDTLNQHTDYLYAHSVGTSLYSVMLAQKVAWHLPTNKFKLAVGGLLHDIGLKEIEQSLLMKPRMGWTIDEVKDYESHPRRSMDILNGIRSIPSDVSQIVHEHHEDCLSQGFPSRVKKTAIYPMAKLASVANEFCNRVIKNPHSPLMTPTEALRQMCNVCVDSLDHAFLNALMDLFNFKPDTDFIDRQRRTMR